jgi:hypothetical protein
VGVNLVPGAILQLGVGIGQSHTRFLAAAAGQSAPDKSQRQDVYITAGWTPTGLSKVNLRLASSRVKYERATAGDFDGLTGALSWVWRTTGRLNLTTTATRDSGQESGFLRLGSSNAVSATDFSQLTNSLSLRADYSLTGKIRLSSSLGLTRRSFGQSATSLTSSDKTRTTTLGAQWAATRALVFICSTAREGRSATGTLSSSYASQSWGCSGQLSVD